VHFVNKVPRTTVKVCKQIDPGSTGDLAVSDVDYTFTVTQMVNGSTTPVGAGTFTVSPPYPPSGNGNNPAACTDVVGSIPLFNADGTPTTVTVTETPGASYSVESITVGPGTPVSGSPDPADSTVTFNPAPGPDIVTFTNSAPALLCFDGTTDMYPGFGGACTIEPGGQAGDLDTLDCPYPFTPVSGCYAGVYRAVEPITGEPIGNVTSLQFDYTGGPLIGGSPRFSVPIDINNDGITDFYLFADAPLCDPTHTGTVDPIHNPLCQVADAVDGVTTWANVVSTHPTWKVSAGDLTFVIADQAYLGTISNVVFGP